MSTSSPFWNSRPTGLKGYRLAAYDELPRTGVPELFRNKDDFEAYVGALVKAGVMKDASYVWWSIRPSLKHPTLELRAPDCPTLVDDTIAIAALWRSLARHLVYNPELNRNIDAVGRAIVVENKWRAQRYGVRGTFIGHGGAISVADLVDQVVDETSPKTPRRSAASPSCSAAAPSSAPAPRPTRRWRCIEKLGKTEGRARALSAVTDWLAATTLQ